MSLTKMTRNNKNRKLVEIIDKFLFIGEYAKLHMRSNLCIIIIYRVCFLTYCTVHAVLYCTVYCTVR